MEILFNVALLLLSGLFFARIFNAMNFPDVTGYLVAGIIVGPSLLGLINLEGVQALQLVSEVALAFIAFSIGSQLKFSSLKQFGSKIVLVTIGETFGAFLLVTLGSLFIFNTSFAFAIVLGSIACATAPAATLMVIQQYKAKGELVDVLVPVVALDDAICIVIFGISSSVASSLISNVELNILTMIGTPLLQILLAVVIGIVLGLAYLFLVKKVRNDAEMLALSLIVILGGTALSLKLGISSLLLLMATGLVITNLGHNSRRITNQIDKVTPPIFLLFFVISGADLNLSALPAVGLIGLFYVVARALGKIIGAYVTTRSLKFSKNVQKYLGLTLIPQAGVAIGLSAIAVQMFPGAQGEMIRTIILGATIVYELIGPVIAKMALTKAGDIQPENL